MKEKKYLLSIEKDNEKIEQLAKKNRRSMKAEINAAIAFWITFNKTPTKVITK